MIPVSDGMSDTTQAIYRRQEGLESTERPVKLFKLSFSYSNVSEFESPGFNGFDGFQRGLRSECCIPSGNSQIFQFFLCLFIP